MKNKISISTKLTLEKTTISQLDTNQLSSLKGGNVNKAKTSCFGDGVGCGTTLAISVTCVCTQKK